MRTEIMYGAKPQEVADRVQMLVAEGETIITVITPIEAALCLFSTIPDDLNYQGVPAIVSSQVTDFEIVVAS